MHPPTPVSHICSGDVHLLSPDGPAKVPGDELVQAGGMDEQQTSRSDKFGQTSLDHRKRAVSGLSTGRAMKEIMLFHGTSGGKSGDCPISWAFLLIHLCWNVSE